MALVDIPLAMAVGLRVYTLMTKSMGMEGTHGQMEESTRATGKKVNSMGSASTQSLPGTPSRKDLVIGKKAHGSNGLSLNSTKTRSLN